MGFGFTGTFDGAGVVRRASRPSEVASSASTRGTGRRRVVVPAGGRPFAAAPGAVDDGVADAADEVAGVGVVGTVAATGVARLAGVARLVRGARSAGVARLAGLVDAVTVTGLAGAARLAGPVDAVAVTGLAGAGDVEDPTDADGPTDAEDAVDADGPTDVEDAVDALPTVVPDESSGDVTTGRRSPHPLRPMASTARPTTTAGRRTPINAASPPRPRPRRVAA